MKYNKIISGIYLVVILQFLSPPSHLGPEDQGSLSSPKLRQIVTTVRTAT